MIFEVWPGNNKILYSKFNSCFWIQNLTIGEIICGGWELEALKYMDTNPHSSNSLWNCETKYGEETLQIIALVFVLANFAITDKKWGRTKYLIEPDLTFYSWEEIGKKTLKTFSLPLDRNLSWLYLYILFIVWNISGLTFFI